MEMIAFGMAELSSLLPVHDYQSKRALDGFIGNSAFTGSNKRFLC
jgi:hypothetical protein